MRDEERGNTVPSLQLEIYRRGGHKAVIEPGTPILDWHFWKDGQLVAVSSGPNDGHVTYALYDSATAHLIERLSEPSDEGLLPQWSKSGAPIQDEPFPMTPDINPEPTHSTQKIP